MSIKGEIKRMRKDELPDTLIEEVMLDFLEKFDETLSDALCNPDYARTNASPANLIACGVSNIIVNMIIRFKNLQNSVDSAKETMEMFDDLFEDIRQMATNTLTYYEASKATENNPN